MRTTRYWRQENLECHLALLSNANSRKWFRGNGHDPLASAKIFGTREFLEDSARNNYGLESPYLPRAVAAHMGLYGNSAAEAVYPTYLADAEGNALDASKNGYALTFEDGNLPPAKAFWSLTMYDGTTQLLGIGEFARLREPTTPDRLEVSGGGDGPFEAQTSGPPDLPAWFSR